MFAVGFTHSGLYRRIGGLEIVQRVTQARRDLYRRIGGLENIPFFFA